MMNKWFLSAGTIYADSNQLNSQQNYIFDSTIRHFIILNHLTIIMFRIWMVGSGPIPVL